MRCSTRFRWRSVVLGNITLVLFVIYYAILGGILLLALIVAAVGLHCCGKRHGLVSSVAFGLPAVVLSLPILLFCAEVRLVSLSVFAAIPLFLGLLDIWRGIRTGEKFRDLVLGLLVCVTFSAFGFLLYDHPESTRWILSHILPTPRG